MSIFGIVLVHLSTTSLITNVGRLASYQAFFLASSGIEQGILEIKNSSITCDNNWQSAEALGNGEFRIRCQQFTPTPAALSGNINSSDTTIPLTSITGYAPIGIIQIGGELINYAGSTTSSSTCALETCNGVACSAPCLIGVKRGQHGTISTSHSIGASVTQDSYTLESEGAVPNLSNAKGKRVLTKGLALSNTAGTAWAGGRKDGFLLQYDGSTWTRITTADIDNVNVINCPTEDFCWAAGDKDARMLRWNGSTWTLVTTPDIDDVHGLSCFDTNNCWAGGERDGRLLRWNGSSWSTVFTSDIDNVNVIDCPAVNFCWAAGNKDARMLRWNGSTWTLVTTPDIDDVHGLSCFDTNNCWAGGERDGRLLRWNGSSWSTVFTSDIDNVMSIDCPAVDFCWASGTRDARHLRWNGSTWSTVTAPDINDHDSVACIDINQCWAGGERDERLSEWDGSSWNLITTQDIDDVQAIATTGSGIGSSELQLTGSKESYH